MSAFTLSPSETMAKVALVRGLKIPFNQRSYNNAIYQLGVLGRVRYQPIRREDALVLHLLGTYNLQASYLNQVIPVWGLESEGGLLCALPSRLLSRARTSLVDITRDDRVIIYKAAMGSLQLNANINSIKQISYEQIDNSAPAIYNPTVSRYELNTIGAIAYGNLA